MICVISLCMNQTLASFYRRPCEYFIAIIFGMFKMIFDQHKLVTNRSLAASKISETQETALSFIFLGFHRFLRHKPTPKLSQCVEFYIL
ncbi:hypothetical protein ANAPC5_01295 [Anaplasma phagocytophilum]|nr:hypothetical protein ANAPC5_01295 [Anaplasma phagocytophilum]